MFRSYEQKDMFRYTHKKILFYDSDLMQGNVLQQKKYTI
jgi:hypothetical protein